MIGHPRHAKRISMLHDAGFEVEVVAFERKYHNGRPPNCPVEKLGVIGHGHYFSRFFKMLKAIPTIRRVIKRNDLVYAFGADMALMCMTAGLFTGNPTVVEIGDVMEPQVQKGIKGWVVRKVDRWMANAARLIVVTAPRFLDVYYRTWVKTKTPGLVMENKLESAFAEEVKLDLHSRAQLPGRPLVDRPLRIGYFGVFRDQWSWEVLESLAKTHPDKFEVVIAGLPMPPLEDLPQWVEKTSNMEYKGQYRSPDDLPELFGDVDMAWACYSPFRPIDWNLRWARPNRFYQSCLFQKPFFSRDGCQDAIDVKKYNIGFTIDEEAVADVVETISKIEPDDIQVWIDNMSKLPRHIYSYTNEVEELGSALREIME